MNQFSPLWKSAHVSYDAIRVNQIKALQQMGFWVIARRSPGAHDTYRHDAIEAHTRPSDALIRQEALTKYYRHYNDHESEFIVLEPFWKVWGQLLDSLLVEEIGLFPSKTLAMACCEQIKASYSTLWIGTACLTADAASIYYEVTTAEDDSEDIPF
jgi:predicted RNA binding protein YcfA (HicA-like mRNA interferase family)